ncbi:strictosidine synthase [Hoeflea marina]|uniref:Strictosidine synthase n=1 Tax=Hoeflea marina TaxID=274592 RepID=A0A317PSY7_9HYPH|nr:strictosidine synthase [Hoeflea marina]PWW04027.1 strictosidine synthase [Hoeflea marina]
MIGALRDWADRFVGRGTAAVTVPPLDGALKPNNRLDEAPRGIQADQPDDIIVANGTIFYSAASRLFQVDENGIGVVAFEATGTITALAVSPAGLIAIASEPGGISFVDGGVATVGQQAWTCVTAMAFANDRTLLVCIGSTRNTIGDWQRDLLNAGKSGEIWTLDISTGAAERLARDLAFPNGIVVEADGNIVISESWRKHLMRLSPAGKRVGQVMEDLPGYPARISRNSRGGYWLSLFAPRSQLIEFVLREPGYRKAMMAEVAPEFWIAPALRSGASFNEPMQGGALKQMGILKPWAPTRSYGLVVELTPDFEPVRSFHSRAGGRRHGIMAAVENGNHLWLASKGGNEVVAIELTHPGGLR